MRIEYPAVVTKHKDSYLVRFPDFPEAATDGATLGEALRNAVDALTVTLEGRMAEGIEVPLPGRRKARHRIAPAARVQSALLVRFARGPRRLAELARRLGTSWPAAARLEDPKHSPTLKQLEKAAAAVGKRLVVCFEDGERKRA
jgi:antitoxin HicB